MYERHRRARLVLVALLLAAVTLLTIDFRERSGGPVERLQQVAISVFGPLQRGGSALVRPVTGFFGTLGDLPRLRQENRELSAEVARLRAQQRRYQDLESENERLRGALAMAERCRCRAVGAQVVARSGSTYQFSVTIDAGTRQGVAPDMAVIDKDGLVGRISHVGPDYATVLLITDPSSGVAARLAGSKAPGLVRGRGPGSLLRFEPVRSGTEARPGDQVVTQAYQGGIFPGGLPVGVVERVDPRTAASPVQQVEVRPYAGMATLDVVAVVVAGERPATVPGPGDDDGVRTEG